MNESKLQLQTTPLPKSDKQVKKSLKDFGTFKSRNKNCPSDDQHQKFDQLTTGITYNCKLVGSKEVNEYRGKLICQDALTSLKAKLKSENAHKTKILFKISLVGITIYEVKTKALLHKHPVNRISFVSKDSRDNKCFGYIVSLEDRSIKYFGFKAEKSAEIVVTSIHDLFMTIKELKSKNANKISQIFSPVVTTIATINSVNTEDNKENNELILLSDQITLPSSMTQRGSYAEKISNVSTEYQAFYDQIKNDNSLTRNVTANADGFGMMLTNTGFNNGSISRARPRPRGSIVSSSTSTASKPYSGIQSNNNIIAQSRSPIGSLSSGRFQGALTHSFNTNNGMKNLNTQTAISPKSVNNNTSSSFSSSNTNSSPLNESSSFLKDGFVDHVFTSNQVGSRFDIDPGFANQNMARILRLNEEPDETNFKISPVQPCEDSLPPPSMPPPTLSEIHKFASSNLPTMQNSHQESTLPPPLPPRPVKKKQFFAFEEPTTKPLLTNEKSSWINFEETRRANIQPNLPVPQYLSSANIKTATSTGHEIIFKDEGFVNDHYGSSSSSLGSYDEALAPTIVDENDRDDIKDNYVLGIGNSKDIIKDGTKDDSSISSLPSSVDFNTED